MGGGEEASNGNVAAVAGAGAGNVSVPPRPKKQQTLSLSGSTKKVTEQKKKQTNKKRKARKGFTIHQNLSICDGIKKGHATQAAIAAKHGTTRCSIINWKRERSTLEDQAGGLNRGKKKRVFVNDPLIKIKEGVIKFYDLNEVLPKASKIPITRKYLSIIIYTYNIFVSQVCCPYFHLFIRVCHCNEFHCNPK